MSEAGEIGGTADHQPLLRLLDQGFEEGRQHGGDRAAVVRLEGLGEVLDERGDVGEAPADDPAVEAGPQVRERGLAEGARAVDEPLLDAPRVRDQYEHQARGSQREQLHVPDGRPGQARVLDDGDLPGELREQPHRAAHDVVEVHGAVEEVLDGPALGRRQRLDPRQLVDEEAVALSVGIRPALVWGWAM